LTKFLEALSDYIYGFDIVNLEKKFGKALHTPEYIYREPRGSLSQAKPSPKPESDPTVSYGSLRFPLGRISREEDSDFQRPGGI
jgi:hypothetical protein